MTPFLKFASASTAFLLAETTASTYEGVRSDHLGEWLVQAAAAAVLIMAIWNLVDRVRGGTSQKREVTFADEYATRKEHEDLKDEVAKLDQERRVSVANLHKKVDENTAITARTEGKLDGLNQQLQQINIHLINRSNK